MNFVVDDAEKLAKFKRDFSPIADFTNIEFVAPLYEGVDYSFVKDTSHGIRGNSTDNIKICPSPFYTMTVTADGSILPCCNYPYPIILGNLNDSEVTEIWSGEVRKNFLRQIIRGGFDSNIVCQKCYMGKYLSQPEDYLDEVADKLLEKI